MQEDNTELQGTLTEEEIEEIAGSRTYTYDLEWPVEFETKEPLLKVELQRFRGKDIKTISKIKDQIDQGMMMVVISSRLTPLEVELMDSVDITTLMEICAVFMSASQRKRKKNTGK
jgi:hypothetical protein